MSTLRTPLAKVRGLGSAKEGADHFWLSRVTAVANIVLVCFLIGLIVRLVGKDYATVKAALATVVAAGVHRAYPALGRDDHRHEAAATHT